MHWKVFLRFHTLAGTTFLLRKGSLRLGLSLSRADVTTAQIWKSLHIVAAAATAVLTRKREISTCPHHIPALALNNTHLLSELKSNPPSPARKKKHPHTLSKDLFRYFEREIQETGDCGAASLSRPNVKQREVFQEFKMSLLNYLTQKLQNVTPPQGNWGRRGRTGGRANSLTLQLYMVSGRKNTVTALQVGLTWPRLNPAPLTSTWAKQWKQLERLHLCDRLQLLLQNGVW